MKKTKLTRSLLAACSIVALTAVVYGCDSGPSQSQLDAEMDRADQAQAQVTMLQGQINALRAQLGLAPDDNLGDSVEELQNQVTSLRMQIADAARKAQEEADRKATEAMAATAAKLYAGIGDAPLVSTGDGQRSAVYSGTGDAEITVTYDPDLTAAGDTALNVELMEDEMTMVAANHGWAGKRYADDAGGDMVEAMVYSDVKAPTMGRKFGSADAVTDSGAYEYQLTNGALPAASLTAAPANVALTGVTRTAGTEIFMLPDPNTNNEQVITRSGSFHGVSGTYSCDTGAGRDQACTATVAAAGGFTLTGTWTFKPGNAEARVMDSADTAYASYGWWLLKAENDGPFIASAFMDYKGGDGSAELASGLNTLNGTATYVGGAAGKYALASSTGGTNDAGHFTARATLEANFTTNDGTDTTTNAITGTIDNFMGADGMSRNWSVKLNGSPIGDTGVIGAASDGTEWTIDGTAAADSGQWSGQFYDNGDDGVPEAATGTFYSEYGTAGRMVGAFGANEQ